MKSGAMTLWALTLLTLCLTPCGSALADAKQPVPKASALSEAVERVNEAYGPFPKEREKLEAIVASLSKDARSVKDPVVRYAMLRVAYEQAVEAEDSALALGLIDLLESGYEIDGIELKLSALKTIGYRTEGKSE